MRISVFLPTALIGASLLAACANENAIFRQVELQENKGIITDAKQRLITISTGEEDNEHVGRLLPKRITCVEPSPDVAQAFSTALSASVEAARAKGPDSKDLAATFGLSTAESIAQLGERLATIQLLRDELADLCRSYSNGAVSATTYTLRLSRLDKKMITLLLGETSAGAFGRSLASISGQASSGFVPAAVASAIEEARNELQDAEEARDTAQDELEKLPSNATAEQRKEKEAQRDKAQEVVNQKRLALQRLERLYAAASAGGQIQTAPGSIQGRSGPIAVNYGELQRQFIEDDDLGTILDACISTLDIRARPSDNAISAASNEVREAERRLGTLRREADQVELRLEQLGRVGTLTAEQQNERESLRRKQIDLEVQAALEARELNAAREAYGAVVRASNTKQSRFADFCLSDDGLKTIVQITKDISNGRAVIAREQRRRAEAEERRIAWKTCEPILTGAVQQPTVELRAYCTRIFAGDQTSGPI